MAGLPRLPLQRECAAIVHEGIEEAQLSLTVCTLIALNYSCPEMYCSQPAPCQSPRCELQALIEVQPLESGASAEVHGQVWCHSSVANALSLLG